MSMLVNSFLGCSSVLRNNLGSLFTGNSRQKTTIAAFSIFAVVGISGYLVYRHLTGRCSQNFICYSGQEVPSKRIESKFETVFSVINQDTIEAALAVGEIVDQKDIAILDMANGKKPGGFHEDERARAQEEQLVRRSPALLAQLEAAKKLRNPNDVNDPRKGFQEFFIPEDGCLFLKDIGYKRNKEDADITITLATICSAALDIFTLGKQPNNYNEIMKNKIQAILYSAYANRKTTIILGAFGCGMYGNLPASISRLFHEVLTTQFKGAFERVIFAVYDRDPQLETLKAFEKKFPKTSSV